MYLFVKILIFIYLSFIFFILVKKNVEKIIFSLFNRYKIGNDIVR